jgi:hypothetical protein
MNHNAGTFRLVHPSDEFLKKVTSGVTKNRRDPLSSPSDVQKIPCLKKN